MEMINNDVKKDIEVLGADPNTTSGLLKELGFENASKGISDELKIREDLKVLKQRITMACEKFRVVKQEHIDRMNEVLMKRSLQEDRDNYIRSYERLRFIDVKNYDKVPPPAILNRIKEVKAENIFDRFEICDIEKVNESTRKPDPIVFGRIEHCPYYFFIGQWDNDIQISDILKDNEG